MEEKVREAIEAIMAQMQCPANFECVESEFQVLCKAEDFGLERYVECLEHNAKLCKFAVSFGVGYLCRCPMRVHLSKELKK